MSSVAWVISNATVARDGEPRAGGARITGTPGVCRSCCCCCPVPCGHGHQCSQEIRVVYHLCCCHQVFWGSGLWAPPLCIPLYVFRSTYLQMYKHVSLSGVLVSWAEEPLLSYGCFTSCRLKGGDKGSVSHHDNADIILGISLEFCLLQEFNCFRPQTLKSLTPS